MINKNGAVLVATACALMVLVVAGVARCSMVAFGPHDEATGGQQEETAQVESGGEEAAPSGEEAASGIPTRMSDLVNTSWEAQDGSGAVLAVMDGAFLETKGAESAAAYYVEGTVQRDKAGFTSDVTLRAAGGTDARQSVVQVAVDGKGATVLTCDALSLAKTYVKKAAVEGKVQLIADEAKLSQALGRETDEVRSAIEAHCLKASPYATKATWSLEVWTDYATGSATTTFTLDDPARTIVTVTAEPGSPLEVL